MARLATGRFKVLSRYRSYHGATMGALSLTGDYRRPPLEPGGMSARERHRHGAALNEIGLRYAQSGRYSRAIEILERAAAIASDDPIVPHVAPHIGIDEEGVERVDVAGRVRTEDEPCRLDR